MRTSIQFQKVKDFDAFMRKVGNIYYHQEERMDRAYNILLSKPRRSRTLVNTKQEKQAFLISA